MKKKQFVDDTEFVDDTADFIRGLIATNERLIKERRIILDTIPTLTAEERDRGERHIRLWTRQIIELKESLT